LWGFAGQYAAAAWLENTFCFCTDAIVLYRSNQAGFLPIATIAIDCGL
jgi:hypothetical protein